MNYYSLIASLPLIQLGKPPPLRLPGFRAACDTHLDPIDRTVLADLLETGGAHSPHPFARAWRDRETEMRNAIVRFRAKTRGMSPDRHLRPQDGARVFIQAGVAEAFQAPNPLERERALDRLRWRVLEELAGLDPFAPEAVFAYGLRLQLAERWTLFDEAAGTALLETAAAAATESETASAPPRAGLPGEPITS